MDCVKWGNDNKEVKDLPLLDEGQAANPNGIKWQDGFDYRFADAAIKFPTKENIDDMLAFVSAKHFYKKCGGMNINLKTPIEEYALGHLPTVERSFQTSGGPSSLRNIWESISSLSCLGGYYYSDSDGNIGMRSSEYGSNLVFLDPKNDSNMERANTNIGSYWPYNTITQSYDLSILGSPDGGVCGLLKTGDTIYFQDADVVSRSIEGNINTIRLVDRAIAEYNGETPPAGFSDFPYFFQAKEKQFNSVSSFSNLKTLFPYHGSTFPNDYFRYADSGRTSSIIDLYVRNDSSAGLSKVNSIVDPDDASQRWYLTCRKAVRDCAMIFDFQPFLNVVKYTSYGDNEMVKEVATFDNGCVNLKNGYYHNLYMAITKTTFPVSASWNPPYDMSDAKPILIASGGQLLCDRIFLRRGSMFNFFLDTNAPVDFRFKATAIPLA